MSNNPIDLDALEHEHSNACCEVYYPTCHADTILALIARVRELEAECASLAETITQTRLDCDARCEELEGDVAQAEEDEEGAERCRKLAVAGGS
jgi:hypothetical protein